MGSLNGGSSNHEIERMFRKWDSCKVGEHEGDIEAFLLDLMFPCDGDHGTGNVESNYVADALCEVHGKKTCSAPGI